MSCCSNTFDDKVLVEMKEMIEILALRARTLRTLETSLSGIPYFPKHRSGP